MTLTASERRMWEKELLDWWDFVGAVVAMILMKTFPKIIQSSEGNWINSIKVQQPIFDKRIYIHCFRINFLRSYSIGLKMYNIVVNTICEFLLRILFSHPYKNNLYRAKISLPMKKDCWSPQENGTFQSIACLPTPCPQKNAINFSITTENTHHSPSSIVPSLQCKNCCR